jgi:hypothetical protein
VFQNSRVPEIGMQQTLKLVAGATAVAGLGFSSLVFVARLGDGPMGPFPGGVLSGRRVDGVELDWRAAAARETVEVQVGVDDPRSVLACLLEFRGEPYLSVTLVPLKGWHQEAIAAGTVILRIDGVLYERGVRPVTDRATRAALKSIAFEKYRSYEFGDGWAGRNLEFLHVPASPKAGS